MKGFTLFKAFYIVALTVAGLWYFLYTKQPSDITIINGSNKYCMYKERADNAKLTYDNCISKLTTVDDDNIVECRKSSYELNNITDYISSRAEIQPRYTNKINKSYILYKTKLSTGEVYRTDCGV